MRYSKLLLLVVLSGFVVENSWAAPRNFLQQRGDAKAGEQIAGNPVGSFQNQGLRSPTNNKWNGNPNKIYCQPGVKCIDETYQDIQLSNEGRKGSFNYYGSMMGFAAGMQSPFHVKRTLEDYLPGDLTLAYITMGLTEPAVAAGLSQAVNYIGNDVNNRLQGEQAFFSQLQYMPEIAQSVGQAHMSCISYHIGKGQTWMAAQARCTGDTADLSKKEKFDDSGAFYPTAFIYDPNHPQAGSNPTGGGSDYIITLSDYLFRRDGKSSPVVEELRTAFTEIIGDVEYELSDPIAAGPETVGTRSIAFRKIGPVKAGVPYSFEQNLQDEMRFVHETLLQLFTEVCFYTAPTGYNTDGIKNEPFLNRDRGGYGNPEVLDWAEKMSFGGFTFDSLFAKALYQLSPPENSSTCPDYYGLYGFDNLIANPNRVSKQGREFLFVSRLVAMGRLYSMFLLAEQYIRKLNVGAFDNFARQAAFELLYESAGSTDIQAVYDDNRQSLLNYQDNLFKRLAGEQRADKMPPTGQKDGATADSALPGSSGATP
jgi:hypothetical protein